MRRSKVLSWREKASSPGTEAWGLGAGAPGQTGWKDWMGPQPLRNPQVSRGALSWLRGRGSSDGLGPASGVDLAKSIP